MVCTIVLVLLSLGYNEKCGVLVLHVAGISVIAAGRLVVFGLEGIP